MPFGEEGMWGSLLVEPMAKGKGSSFLLRLSVDNDHLGILDLKDARAQCMMESTEPRRQRSLNGELLGGFS